MDNIFQRVFGRREKPISTDCAWESRLSFEHAQIDRPLLLRVLQDPKHTDLIQQFYEKCLSLTYDKAILLQQEISLLQQYIQLYERYEDNIHFSFELKVSDNECFIGPLMLFPLIQNAILSSYFVSDARPIRCKILMLNNILQIEVSNRVNPYLRNQSDTECMRFFKSRLKIAYGEKYDLFINSNSNLFKATLRIELRSSRD